VRGARAAILEGRFGAYAAEQRAAMDVAQAARIG
jgi:hypothetical protein